MLNGLGKWFVAWIAVAYLILQSGCGIEPLATSKVSGIVTLDGQAVESAMVVFVPIEVLDSNNRKLPFSYGVTDEEGRYQLKRFGGDVGAPIGRHVVLIKKSKKSADSKAQSVDLNPPESNEDVMDDINQEINDKLSSLFKIEDAQFDELIPAIYNRQSILDFEVLQEEETTANFELSSIDPLLKK